MKHYMQWSREYDYHSEELYPDWSPMYKGCSFLSYIGFSMPKIQGWCFLSDYGEESPPYDILVWIGYEYKKPVFKLGLMAVVTGWN